MYVIFYAWTSIRERVEYRLCLIFLFQEKNRSYSRTKTQQVPEVRMLFFIDRVFSGPILLWKSGFFCFLKQPWTLVKSWWGLAAFVHITELRWGDCGRLRTLSERCPDSQSACHSWPHTHSLSHTQRMYIQFKSTHIDSRKTHTLTHTAHSSPTLLTVQWKHYEIFSKPRCGLDSTCLSFSPFFVCLFAWNRKRSCLFACWHQETFSFFVSWMQCVWACRFLYELVCSSVSQFLLSCLCVIGSEPVEPFVWVLPCAYINCVGLINNIGK